MHDDDFEHEHDLALTEKDLKAVAEAILEQDSLELLTVGIDIGSSTSHLLFAKVLLRRQTHELSSRFEVVDRQVVWQSPIIYTPFAADGLIDAHELAHFIEHQYEDAGLTPGDVDSGAVILTGEAIKRPNARAIDEIFASQSGKFVCATAGHELESILAAHGSGATALSQRRGSPSLHVDIGGGTTKLALIDDGEVLDVAAFAVGGRLLARDRDGGWTRIDDSARLVAEALGIELTAQTAADPAVRQRITQRLAQAVIDEILGVELDSLGLALRLTGPLQRTVAPDYLTFSGGVSEYIFGHEQTDFGDLAGDLAREIIDGLRERVTITSVDAGQRIRATVIGASQYTVQVSGKTIHLDGATGLLPIQNVPVVHLGTVGDDEVQADAIAMTLQRAAQLRGADVSGPVALAFRWEGTPSYEMLSRLAQALRSATTVAASSGEHDHAHAHTHTHGHKDDPAALFLVIDGDIAQTLGRILTTEIGMHRPAVAIDGIELKELDYVDIGELMDPPGVVPVVIKSLLFS